MERGHDEYRCLNSSPGDLQLLQSVSEMFFAARENDEETVDSDSESSSSDSCDDLEDTQDLHLARLIADCLEQSLEKLKPPSTTSSLQLKQRVTRTR